MIRIRKMFSYSADTDPEHNGLDKDEFVLSHEMNRQSVPNNKVELITGKKKGHGNLGYFVMSHKNEELKKQLRGSGSNDTDIEAIRKEGKQRLAQFEDPIKEVKKDKEEKQNQRMVEEEESVNELKKANLKESQSTKDDEKQKQGSYADIDQKSILHDKENESKKVKIQKHKKDNNKKKEKKQHKQTIAV